MSHRNLWAAAAAAILAALLAGCQNNTPEGQLPPLRLGAPQIESPSTAWVHASGPPIIPHAIMPPSARPQAAPPAAPAAAGGVPIAWIPQAKPNHWMWIIIHHSDSDYGSAAVIDKWHRDRGFDELGYHFVIGNGTQSGDGQIEVGGRWTKQKWGAHDNALDNRYNTNGIGICLVGNFNKTHPTEAQRRAVIRLVVYLMRTYHIPASHVLGHGETKVTQCPGRYLRMAEIRAAVTQLLAEASDRLAASR
ncbi:MAG: peptidoglycan recognition family protein [Tepidisphaeraceae bacterium]|jgi:hypothetical protein